MPGRKAKRVAHQKGKKNYPQFPLTPPLADGRTPVVHLLLLVILSGGVYLNTLGNPFVWDDLPYISQNSHFQKTGYLSEYFTASFCKGAAKDCAFYRPLVGLSYLVDYLIWGNKPFGFHLTNVIIHIGVVLLYYGVTLRLFQSLRVSLIAALVFAVHPIHSESVAFVAARTDPPTAIFLLVSLWTFDRYLRTSEGRRFLALGISLVTYGLALLTKEIAITLPLLLLLYDLLFMRPWKGMADLFSRWRPYLLYGVVVLLYFVARQGALGYGLTHDLKLQGVPLRLITAPSLIWDYFRLQVVPYPLMISHGIPHFFGSANLAVLWGPLFLAVYLFLLFWVGRFSKGILFGGLWFVFALLPILNIIPIPWAMVIERFSYIPSMGFALVIGFLGDLLMGLSLVMTSPRVRRGIVGLFMTVLVLFSVMTVMRNRIWSDEILLWKDTVQKAPRFAAAHMNLGLAYHERGDLEQAARSYQESLIYDPSAPKAHHNLGRLYQERGQVDQALEQYQQLINLGQAVPATYYNMGILYEDRDDFDRAVFFYRESLQRNPDYYKAHVRLGRLLDRLGNREEALREYREAIRISPRESMGYLRLADLLESLGRLKEAEEAYGRYLEFSPPDRKESKEYLLAQKRLEELRRQGRSDH